ncbi:phosphate ABC transporter permease PstA [Brevibacterium gallinarum]|uniref:Phosphate transport system permease protein PstA n=1 Tax=Brevibacterium gallinarum TaxID=2762220 RepID=A0ABR8WVM7_9MICO|nr:phosphate ABC transporter permease PstA [Brevibacterium gallinarum]MBD8020968.1 phosphate ABC transporter permease PstA [Brevibacterium gallinarum]
MQKSNTSLQPQTQQPADPGTPAPRQKKQTAIELKSKQLPKWAPWGVAAAAIIAAIALSFIFTGGFNVPLAALLAGVINLAVIFAWSFAVEGQRKATDRVATTLVTSAFAIACIPLISLLWTALERGGPVLLEHPSVLNRTMQGMKGVLDQEYVAGEASLAGGFYHAIAGTILITLASCVISIPIGVLTAIYLVEYGGRNPLARGITFLVDVMTGIPSIVAGLFAFSLFGTIAAIVNPGAVGSAKTGIAAAVALSVLMIPVVVRNTEEILRLVPMDLREATYALGVPKWKTIVRIVLPTAISGILSGITIAIARVIGETAPIMVTAGFAKNLNWDLLSGWMSTLPTYIYDSQMRPVSPGVAAAASSERAWAAALVLIIIVMLLNLIARLIAKALAPKAGR